MFFFFFKQKTAYEMRISAWSSDVCSSDLADSRDERERGSVSAGPAIANPSPRNRSNNAAELSRRAQGDAQKSDRLLSEQRLEVAELRHVLAQIDRSVECGGPIEYHALLCVGDRQTNIVRMSHQSC